ncbi:MAG TPA: polysaccharide biosynthesis/export family protein [Verrucomicrobiae bacterium]|jgi:protein involved in polysaccharide export with SLBB domain|nr:polysaccharide biosynthesis/export family protein [Verrucomicrobiae bacterium]
MTSRFLTEVLHESAGADFKIGMRALERARKRFFLSLASGCLPALLLISGCKTPDSGAASYAEVSHPQSPTESMQMQTVTNELDPALLRAPTNLFTLGPGDKLDIEMPEETNSLTTTVVGPDGKVYFGLLPGLDVWGLTLGQTREMIEHELSRYVRGQPQVNVTLRDVQSKHVWLLGRFQAPGIYNMAAPTTLLEAIAAAGGSQSFAGQRQISEGGPLGEDLADLHRSFVVRGGQMLPVDLYRLLDKGDLSQNIYLQPDDFVYFAPGYAKEVYVLGAVVQPKPVQYIRGMSLMQAIAGAYGTVRDAYLAHVTIVRGSLSQPQVAFVNYYDIVKGKAPDVQLQPNDIVYVPLTRYRYLRKYLDIALNTFVSSVAINEGTKISTPNSRGIPGVVIPAGSGITIVPSPAPPIH